MAISERIGRRTRRRSRIPVGVRELSGGYGIFVRRQRADRQVHLQRHHYSSDSDHLVAIDYQYPRRGLLETIGLLAGS